MLFCCLSFPRPLYIRANIVLLETLRIYGRTKQKKDSGDNPEQQPTTTEPLPLHTMPYQAYLQTTCVHAMRSDVIKSPNMHDGPPDSQQIPTNPCIRSGIRKYVDGPAPRDWIIREILPHPLAKHSFTYLCITTPLPR